MPLVSTCPLLLRPNHVIILKACSLIIRNISIGTKTCSGPPNRLTSCRVCVRSLSTGNSDVSYRICSQCNLKVCEDCASYSELDKDIERVTIVCGTHFQIMVSFNHTSPLNDQYVGLSPKTVNYFLISLFLLCGVCV